MNRYDLLREIISYLEDFEKTSEQNNIKDFSIFLKEKVFNGEKPSNAKTDEFEFQPGMGYRDFPEVEFSTLVGTMFRFARHYIKKALENSEIKSLDEFGFLATLVDKGSLNKSELIQNHLMEISSGSEILKRLVKKGFIKETEDEKDKRGVKVDLTEAGRMEIYRTFGQMYKVAQVVKGNLNHDELIEMNFLLNKLRIFHWNIHEHDKTTQLDVLIEKYT